MLASTATRHGCAGRGAKLGGLSFSFSCIGVVIFHLVIPAWNQDILLRFLRCGVYAIMGNIQEVSLLTKVLVKFLGGYSPASVAADTDSGEIQMNAPFG